MKMIAFSRILPVLPLLFAATAYAQNKTPQLGRGPIPAVVQAMTLEEKAKIVVGNGFSMPGMKTNAATNNRGDHKGLYSL